ncbi:unnamed protein product, partial [Gongylonema pulchrum]
METHLLGMNIETVMTTFTQPNGHLQLHVARRLLYLLRLFPTAFTIRHVEDLLKAFTSFPEPSNLADVEADDLRVGEILLNAAAEMPLADDRFVVELIPFVAKWEAAVVFEVEADDLRVGEILLNAAAEMPLADDRFVVELIPFVAKWEAAVVFENPETWRYFLLRYLLRYPLEAYMVAHKEGQAFRDVLIENKNYLQRILQGESMVCVGVWAKSSVSLCVMELLAMKLILSIGNRHPNWATGEAKEIVTYVHALWKDLDFHKRYTRKDYLDEPRYEVPKLAALIMLRYFKSNTDRFDIIFDLCDAFANDYISAFTFLRLFIEKEIIPKYSLEWRQNALKRIVAKFEEDPSTAHSMNTVKVLQHIVIPSLHYAFERYNVDLVVGTPAKPADVDDNNLISLVCHKVLD